MILLHDSKCLCSNTKIPIWFCSFQVITLELKTNIKIFVLFLFENQFLKTFSLYTLILAHLRGKIQLHTNF